MRRLSIRRSRSLRPPPWEEWHSVNVAMREAAGRRHRSVPPGWRAPTPTCGSEPWLAGVQAAQPETASAESGSQPALFEADDSGAVVEGAMENGDPGSAGEPPGAAKGPRDVELPPWSKGRYGTAVGRAVHGVLQAIDLASGEGLDQLVAAQCAAEGVVPYADIVRGCVRSALQSDIVQRAAARQHWRESFVGRVLDDGTVVEGFVDLMYREDDGTLVVVDYKTDDIRGAAIGRRTDYYRPQIAAYLDCLRSSGAARCTGSLLFLNPAAAAASMRI